MKLFPITDQIIVNLDLVEIIELKDKMAIFYTPNGTQEAYFSGTVEELFDLIEGQSFNGIKRREAGYQ